MSNFLIRIEPFPGADINRCAAQAIQLANKLDVTVMFGFNGVSCMACPGDSSEALAAEYQRLLSVRPGPSPHIARGRTQ